jgi:hypothetical protein
MMKPLHGAAGSLEFFLGSHIIPKYRFVYIVKDAFQVLK